MSNPHVARLKKHFPAYVYNNIAACLKMNQGIGATILICCAIDTLASYAAANPSVRGNKIKFTGFVSKYFPANYDPNKFYKIIRCGLVHSFNMENKYYILCSSKTSAQKHHLTKPKGYNREIVNPYTLFRHLKKAHKNFIEDLENDISLRKTFSDIYKKKPIKTQSVKPRTFLKKQKKKHNKSLERDA